MLPYTTPENDWLSNLSLPRTESGHIDTAAIEAQARFDRSRMIGRSFARLISLWRGGQRKTARLNAKQCSAVQHELNRAALTVGRF